MVTPIFAVYGAGDGVGHHVVLQRGAASTAVTEKAAASWISNTLGIFGSDSWFVIGDGVNTVLAATAMLDTDTDPPDQGGVNNFGTPGGTGATLILPLEDGSFVMALGSYVYVQSPDDTSYASRLFVSNLNIGGVHNVVAMSLVGTTAKIMYATRGNAARTVRVLTVDLTSPPSGTVDMTSLPSYNSVIAGNAPWQDDENASYNWYTGLIPNVMGAFDYCVYRNADRTNDGVTKLTIGVAPSAPYSSGGEMVMAGYQIQLNKFGSDTTFLASTFGGTLASTSLTAQSQLFGPVSSMSEVIAESGVSDIDYYFDAYRCGLALSFAAPPGPPAFWTNLRQATEQI